MEKTKKYPKHPAPFSPRVIKVINSTLDLYTEGLDLPSRLYDPFLGAGGVAAVTWGYHKLGTEIEPEWAAQAQAQGIETRVGTAQYVRFAKEHLGVICTAPTCGDRLARHTSTRLYNQTSGRQPSYRAALKRFPTRGSSAGMHWGPEYRALHDRVWKTCVASLCPGGLLVLNIKDFIKDNRVHEVAKWHVDNLRHHGLEVLAKIIVPLPGHKSTSIQVGPDPRGIYYEWVFVLQKPVPPGTRRRKSPFQKR